MNPNREELLAALADMTVMYPEWRLGQMIDNLVCWAKQPKTPEEAAGAGWDIEDEELLITIKDHLERRREALQNNTPIKPSSLCFPIQVLK